MKPSDLDIDIKIPGPKEWPKLIKLKLKEYFRVLKITKKPNKDEFTSTFKVTGLGTLLIGAIGFALFVIVQLIRS